SPRKSFKMVQWNWAGSNFSRNYGGFGQRRIHITDAPEFSCFHDARYSVAQVVFAVAGKGERFYERSGQKFSLWNTGISHCWEDLAFRAVIWRSRRNCAGKQSRGK